MNTLETYLKSESIPESKAMDALQDHGIISDHCVWARDVAECQCADAIFFLKMQGRKS